MGRDTSSFRQHVSAKPFYKKPGPLAAIGLFASMAGFVAFSVKAEDKVFMDRIESKGAVATPAAYVLGLRGVKTDAARDALETLLAANEGERATPPDLRRAIAFALGSVRQAQVVDHLAEACLKDPVGPVRATSARALGRTGQLGAAEPLIRALDDPDQDVRIAAAGGCGTLKDERAIDKLIEHVTDPVYDVRRAMQRALIAITGQDFDIDGPGWRKWRDAHH